MDHPMNVHAYFSEDIILQILSRIPPMNLIRFRSVCKHWRILISDPGLAKMCLTHTQPEIIFATGCRWNNTVQVTHYCCRIQEKDMRAEKFSLSPEKYLKCKLLTSCNGLILLQDLHDKSLLYVSNPCTLKFKTLPRIHTYIRFQWTLVHGDSSGKYKVFGISLQEKYILTLTLGGKTCVWIESKITGLPKFISSSSPFLSSPFLGKPFVGKEELHWIVATEWLDDYIYSIDTEDFQLRITKLPSIRLCGDNFLAEVKGTLYLTNFSGIGKYLKFDVWALDDRVNNSWTKCYTFSVQTLSKIPTSFGSHIKFFDENIFASMSDFHDLLSLVKILLRHKKKYFLYDLKSQELQLIENIKKNSELCDPCVFHTKSLVSW